MSTTFIATLVVKAGMEERFEKLQAELSELTHAKEPDTLAYDVIKHRTEPRTYVVYARFRNEAAFQLHQATTFHERLVPPIVECLAKDFAIAFYDWKS
jgi:quinol monooxygenase YgiN